MKLEIKQKHPFHSVEHYVSWISLYLRIIILDQNDSVAWYRDKESRYGDHPVIASLSFGQTRKFEFRKFNYHQSRHSIPLPHGSLLMIKADIKEHWEHRIAKSK